MWEIWVCSRMVDSVQRVLWVDAIRAGPGGSLETSFGTRGGGGTRPGHWMWDRLYLGGCRKTSIGY